MEMRKVMRIGTRKSELALAQTRLFIEACRAAEPDFSYEIIEMSTAGDRIPDKPLYEFAGKGMFVTVFEDALLSGGIDAAVHSGKDMPEKIPEGLTVSAVLPRANPCDVLVTLRGRELRADAVIGTGSLRRRAQTESALGYRTKNLRGNVGTRLQKLKDGEVDGLILAAAGLERLGLLPDGLQTAGRTDSLQTDGGVTDSLQTDGVTDSLQNDGGGTDNLQNDGGGTDNLQNDGGIADKRQNHSVISGDFVFTLLDTDSFLPAAAQGIIAVESRSDSPFAELFERIGDPETMRCFLAERTYLARIGAGCQQPVAAYARCQGGLLRMDAAYWEQGTALRFAESTQPGDAERLAERLAEKIMTAREKKKRDGRATAEETKQTEAKQTDRNERTGHVYLVGAGPGAGDLITVRGLELLRACDVVIYDRLSGEELLSEVRPGCERIYAGKQAGSHSMKQEEISRLLVSKAQEGKTVVRLKGGDPFVFGRGGEEAEALIGAGVPFTVVPGVTSAVAAAELSGIPVTHREMSRSFHVITAHTSQREPQEIRAYLRKQIMSLKDAEGTLVFLMGLSSLETICELLIESGRPPSLPAAVIGSSSRFCETTVRGTLEGIAEKTRRQGVSSPAVIVVGECAALSLETKRELPLHGMRVGLTGTGEIMKKIGAQLRRAGAETLFVQELLICPLPGQDLYFENLSSYTWLAFTSANGVRLFFEQMVRKRLDLRMLSALKFAAVGAGTARALSERGIFADYIPESYTVSQGLRERLIPGRDSVLVYQAKEGNPALVRTLTEAGISVTRADAYESRTRKLCGEKELLTLSYLTFASGSGVRAFADAYPDFFAEGRTRGIKAAAIGPQTAQALLEAGCAECLTAETYTAQGLAEIVIRDSIRNREERRDQE